MTLIKRRSDAGAYQILDDDGTVVARVEEWGVAGYRWRVSFTDRSIRGWDSRTIDLDGIAVSIASRVGKESPE